MGVFGMVSFQYMAAVLRFNVFVSEIVNFEINFF